MTQYVITDRTTGDHWALQITDSQLNWTDLGAGGSPQAEPIFLDSSSGGHYVKLYINNGVLGTEYTATQTNNVIILQDTTIAANLWTLGVSNWQVDWFESSPTPRLYDRFKYNLFRGRFEVGGSGGHQLKVVLLNNTYSFNPTNNILGDILPYEVIGSGYTTGGVSISSFSVTQDDVNYRGVFLASGNAIWNNSSITARYAAIYDATMINKDLVCCIDFMAPYTSTNETFQLTWGSSGILLLE